MSEARPAVDWYGAVYEKMRAAGVDLFTFVPDEALSPFLKAAEEDPDVEAIAFTTEEDGVAVCCGAWLGGRKSVLMMQSSGVGNCLNAFTLLCNCRFPMLLIVAMRGEFGEAHNWQIPMGSITQQTLELSGFHVWRATRPDEILQLIDGALKMTWRSEQPIAILLSQRLVGAKEI